ncbi:hypothetical protein QQF64_026405 [Cirrhinus molitorella]|uniref:PLA2c domain-containing protein n=1 Tax=Cirrhinus molitorella TaxID=172907 RepID=A0ABR3NA35_9TELE
MVRIKPSQNGRIQEFAASRRNIVLQALKKLQIQCSQVPNIALLGSGGGQRAMVGLLGSLVELDKAGLLDCILYLSGVSGSTWCMASLYKEPDWSTKLETVKDQIVKRLSGPRVSWGDALAKLKKYYNGNNFFSLTDFWAAMVVTSYVKEIDEHTLTEHWKQQNKDPFPIYTVIDKQCKHGNDGDPWFEINPHEAGYSLTGAFVETCNFGSQFHEGSKKNHQGEFDMLYLQDGAVPATLLKSETRDYIDAGLLLNSPYFSVLSEERNTDLIISLDFSQDGSFVTVENAAEMCRERNIPFPEVNITSEDREKPKDFYVFKGQKGPTVIHIPLFNVVNCGGKFTEIMSAPKPPKRGEVRIKPLLNQSEQEFVTSRRNTVFQTLKKLQIQCSQDKVPNIALLGSGGGQRAMVGLLGSLVELHKAGLLDCILYLSGVSGSTWCMASLYQEPDWSTKLEAVKAKIVERLSGPGVSWTDKLAKLKKYYMKDSFSLTDLWAVLFVTSYVKEIDEQTLTDQWDQHSKDPYPIYAVIDKQCKRREEGDPWLEISPHEAGYSLTGAFVETSSFGSQFDNGSKKKHQPEMDMLYLQAMCSSALADGEATWKWVKAISVPELKTALAKTEKEDQTGGNTSRTTQQSAVEDECYQELASLANADPSAFAEATKSMLPDLSGGQQTADNRKKTFRCITQRIWGRNYNFLHNMTDESVPAALLQKEMRDYIDAGLLINSPYFSVLRKERNIDLIIALDFSDGDPFTTVRETAKTCKKLKIPFPEVDVPSKEGNKPKDFYVFKGQNAPTVIHMPLFNVVNCGDKPGDWRKKYGILKGPYTAEMTTEVMEVAGKNISNNIEKLLEQIRAVAAAK